MKSTSGFRIDFLVPGFSKCGTTTLCELLAEHPQIYIPPGAGKEPLHFIREDYKRREPAYHALFAAAGETQLLAEGSTFYSSRQEEHGARERIFEHNPDMRFIWIARDPLDRIVSSFREFHHSAHLYGLSVPFELHRALEQIPALTDDTCFWARLGHYRERFDDRQMLIVFLEELRADPLKVLESCYRFLGVDPQFRNQDPRLRMNAGETKLQDARLLRWLRNNRYTGRHISALDPVLQDRIFSRIGLRRPFCLPVDWDARAQAAVIETLYADAMQFLAHAGREKTLWPTLMAAAATSGVSA